MKFVENELPRKINIGCGFDIRPGYLNVDSGDWHKPDLIADVSRLDGLPEAYFEEAVAQDVFEHIPRTEQVSTLRGWSRLLVEGGSLFVRVPSIVDLVDLLKTPAFADTERQHYWVQMVHGTQAYPGDFHLCAYTPATLVDVGRQAGLFVAEASIMDGWLFNIRFRKSSDEDDLTAREWVTHHYMCQARRVPDAGGLEYWTSVLMSGTMTKFEIAHTLKMAR